MLADAEVAEGEIRIKDETYSVFILPPVTHIKESTLRKLTDFVDGGGALIGCTFVPVGLLEAAGGDGALAPLDSFFGLDARATIREFSQGAAGDTALLQPDPARGFTFIKGSGLARAKPDETLRRVLNNAEVPDVAIDDEEIFYLHRSKDGFELYFLVNTSKKIKQSVQISFEQAGRPEVWNPTTGQISSLPAYEVQNGRTAIHLDFPPSESWIVVFDGTKEQRHVTETNLASVELTDEGAAGFGTVSESPFAVLVDGTTRERWSAEPKTHLTPIECPNTFAFETEQDNILVVGAWRMRMEEEIRDTSAVSFADFDDSDWLEVTNGAWEMQLPQERDEQIYPVSIWYRTTFEIQDLPKKLHLLIDGFSGSAFELYLNGRRIEDGGTRSWLDAEIPSIDVRDFVETGKNHVVVRLDVTRRTDGILDLLKIAGDFSLARSEGGHRIASSRTTIEAGDWTTQGFPFFSGTGLYRTAVEIPKSYLDEGRVYLEADCGEDVLEVRVNGSDPLIAPWHPYRLDVTEDLRPGKNQIEIRVTNTLINILEGEARPSGLFTSPRLVHVHRYELHRENQ